MRHAIIVIYALLLNASRSILMFSGATMKLLFVPGLNRLRIFNGKAKAYAEFIKAKKHVPAYEMFLKENNFHKISFNGLTPNIQEIPVTDKNNYVNKYSLEQRCINGKIPSSEVIIDESSGSSGTAINWARGKSERKNNAKFIRFGLLKVLADKQPLFIINAFALGSWATGMNITMSCIPFTKIKSPGPDKIKIENTLTHFGKNHHYVILGYPPFLKLLVDTAAINWSEYNVSLIFGGEPMSEAMREVLIQKGIKKIFSSLGASDLELNMAAENDFTISLRKLLRSNEALRKRILKYTGGLPMVFQYNPADFIIEPDTSGELIITIARSGYISPKIRYNLHDRGQVLQMKDMFSILKEFNINKHDLTEKPADLPILFHYGRADMTVSFFGSNISAVDIQETIYHFPQLVETIHSFCISVTDDEHKQLLISMELQQHKTADAIDLANLQIDFFEKLSNINQDFRESKKMLEDIDQTKIVFCHFGKDNFAGSDVRIKAKYII